MSTNIQRIVVEDISNKITQSHVLFEAITNSIQANAKHIICRFSSDQSVLRDENGELIPRKVDNIEIEDDGDGFTNENIKSFKEYRTSFKASLGCKGVGRLSFLKIFKEVNYTSYLETLNVKRTFPLNFELDNISPVDKSEEVPVNKTILSLKGVTTEFFRKWKTQERRIDLDLDNIRQEVLVNIIPTLFFEKDKGENIKIDFIDTATGEERFIVKEDIPDFKVEPFEITDVVGNKHIFYFRYFIEHVPGGFYTYYCANRRTVTSFSEKDFKVTLPKGHSGYFLLESQYLDENVDNDRNEFDILPVRTDAYCPISWDMINATLRPFISKIISLEIPEAITINKTELRRIQETRPYLVEYIEEDDINIAGFIDNKKIVEKAKKRFESAKDKLISDIGWDNYTDDDLRDAIQLTQNELVSYIQDRLIIINRLKTMLDNKEHVEKLIHDLFMPQHTEDDYYCDGKNNLWLLDDKFISYTYAASDKKIKHVLESQGLESGTNADGDKPDLSLFFPESPFETNNDLKSVIVEIKPFDYKNKPARKKFAGLLQLRDYIKAFQEKDNIKEVWAFLVTDVDDEFAEMLSDDEYKPLFSTDRPIYHRFFPNLNTSIYVLGVKTLIADAAARNKTFIDIINKHNKLKKYLQ